MKLSVSTAIFKASFLNAFEKIIMKYFKKNSKWIWWNGMYSYIWYKYYFKK